MSYGVTGRDRLAGAIFYLLLLGFALTLGYLFKIGVIPKTFL
jgi:hypothetical protein